MNGFFKAQFNLRIIYNDKTLSFADFLSED